MITSVPYFLAYAYYRSILDEKLFQSILEKDNTTLEKYTIVILSQPKRLRTLKTVVCHYSRCPSVDSIVIVWGDQKHPLSTQDLPVTNDVPVRIRTEAIDTLNNRFQYDPQISTEAVLSLDDDTLMLCQDVENGFEEWKLNRNRLVGYFPRLVVEEIEENFLSKPHRSWRRGRVAPTTSIFKYLGEREAYKKGEYNLILTVAMFYNVALMEEYWQPVGFAAAGRELVDKIHNCEDILMNYIAAGRVMSQQNSLLNSTAATAIKYVRPRRRLDLSKLTSVGISHHAAAHLAKRERCITEFVQYIHSHGLSGKYPELLASEKFEWEREVAGRPLCWLPFFGCIYL
jgi:Glycosyl transferase family 64 domain